MVSEWRVNQAGASQLASGAFAGEKGISRQESHGPTLPGLNARRRVKWKQAYGIENLPCILSDGAWEVKSEGAKGHIYPSQREAIAAALQAIRNNSIGQLVIHGKKGQIRERDTYGMTPIQDPPRRSRAAKRIGRAVGKVALQRVRSDSSQ